MGLSPSLFMLMSFLFLLSLFSLISSRQPLCHDVESFALLQFKESFIFNRSASYAPSAFSKVSSRMIRSNDCCTWDGVECDENTGHVVSLDLSNSSLYGSINSSSSLFQLVHLQKLNLAYNNFNHSEIPIEVGWLSKLTDLNLSCFGFLGEIPAEILQLSKLVFFDLYLNPLTLHKLGLESIVEKLRSCLDLLFSITHNSVSITHNSKLVGPMTVWFVWICFQFLFPSLNSLNFLITSYGN